MDPERQQTPHRPPTRVILVEDLVDHQVLVQMQLKTFRQETDLLATLGTVAEAVAVLQERADEVDCIISDLGLPDGQGTVVVEALAQAAPGTPIVVLTSRLEQGVSALRAGAQDYLVKGKTDSSTLERAIRHAMARQLLANELQATTRDVEHLVYSVSHDLRGPLSVANGFVSLLEEASLPKAAAELVSPIKRSLARLDSITSDLIHYAKSVHGDLEVDRVDLGILVRTVAADQLVTDMVAVDDSMPVVLGDGRLLRHVFDNLIGNAIKYAEPTRRAAVSVHASEHPIGWRVDIDDNGMGIPAAAAEQIFDMFRRGVDDSIEGSGIGLAICRRAIERHKGRIWAQANPSGLGTRVSFLLPSDPIDAATAPADSEGADA